LRRRSVPNPNHLLTTAAPTLIITDINMPGADGVWLLKQVRGACPRMAVLAMSGRYDAVSASDAGFDAFLQKPVDPEVLCAGARAALDAPR
jgi:DNA-binding response OmpR family regulator